MQAGVVTMKLSDMVIISIASILLFPLAKPLGWLLGSVAMLSALLLIQWFLLSTFKSYKVIS